MGLDEAVTPVFPNSDYGYVKMRLLNSMQTFKPILIFSMCSTGVAGCASVLDALTRRAEQGGSYGIDVSRNCFSSLPRIDSLDGEN